MNYTFATIFAKNQAAAQEIVGDGYFNTEVKTTPEVIVGEDGSTTTVEGTGGETWFVSSGAWDNEPLMQIVNADIKKIVRFPDGQMEGFELVNDPVEE